MESSNPNPAPATGGVPANNPSDVPTDGNSIPQAPYSEQPATTQPWSSGLCDCFSDVPNCFITLFFPCITFGQISEIVDQGASSCGVNGGMYFLIALMTVGLTGWNCACFYSCFYRTHIRMQYSLEESPIGDCLLHAFCEQCALCQEYRELQHRGYNMALGWHGNMQRQRQNTNEITMRSGPPAVEQGMSRDKEST